MEKQFSTLWQPAFPNVPMQTNMGTPILQPGITKYEFIALQIYLNKEGSNSNESGKRLSALNQAKFDAKEFIEAFDKEAEILLKVQQEKISLKV